MRILFFVLGAFFISNTLSAQFKLSNLKNVAWLPENYVKADLKNDTTAYKHLMPIEGIENPFLLGNIKIFGVEPMVIKTKTVMQKGVEKQLITSLNNKLLTKDSTNFSAIQLSKASVCISMVGDKLLLEIIEKGKKQEILFVNQLGDYQFKSIDTAKKYLADR